MEHDKARKHSRRDAGEHHRHKRHHRHSDDRERGDYAPNYSDSRTDARASYAAQSQADDVDSQASLELTLAMWESPGVRAATRELFFGSSSRSPLPLNLEEKFDDFVRLYLRRRATTKTRPPPTNADPPAAPPAMAGGRAPYSAAIDNSASSMSSSMSSSGVGSSSFFIDRQPSSKESLPNSRSSKLALPTGPFDRRFTVNCVVRTGTEGEAPRHTQPRNAAEASHESLQALRRAASAGTRAISTARLPPRDGEAARAHLRHFLSPPASSAPANLAAIRAASSSSSSSSSLEEAASSMKHEPALDCVKLLVRLFLDFRAKQSFKQLQALQATKQALPITSWEERVLVAVAENQVVLVVGDTGCGKSTQVPQFLLRAGYRRVACTQPRRVACVALAKRVAYESLGCWGTNGVGYQIRFQSSAALGPRSSSGGYGDRGGQQQRKPRLVFITEGLLLRQVRSDPLLLKYDVLVVDEVHERHLPADILLGVLKVVLEKRNLHHQQQSASSSPPSSRVLKPLRVVLMSATLNASLFSDYFKGAPVLNVPGRMFPVTLEHCRVATPREREERHRLAAEAEAAATAKARDSSSSSSGEASLVKKETEAAAAAAQQAKRRIRENFDPSPYVHLLQRIDATVPTSERGDLLVFLSGMSDLTAVASAARDYATTSKKWIVLLLHSALDSKEQDLVFHAAPPGVRKCVLSTNIAESSVTLDGVRFVADSGRGKELFWDPTSNTRSLQEVWVSKASAEQRKGRAGRTGPGQCFRFYSVETLEDMAPYADPEALKSPLASVVLDLKALGCRDPRAFPFLTPPPPSHMTAALLDLALLGATRPLLPYAMAAESQLDASITSSSKATSKLVPGSLKLPSFSAAAVSDDGHDDTKVSASSGSSVVGKEQPTPSFDVLVALSADAAVAPLTPLGKLMADLPVEPPVSRMLAIAAALSRSTTHYSHHRSSSMSTDSSQDSVLTRTTLTLAASLSCASPFDFRAARDPSSEASRTGKRAFESTDGDPFTARRAFEAWVLAKAGKPPPGEGSHNNNKRSNDRRSGNGGDYSSSSGSSDMRAASRSSRAWCARHGLQESRLYEIAKLRAQLDSALKHTMRFSTLPGADAAAATIDTGASDALRRDGVLAPQMTHETRLSKYASSTSSSGPSASLVQALRQEAADDARSRKVLTLQDCETHRIEAPNPAAPGLERDEARPGVEGFDASSGGDAVAAEAAAAEAGEAADAVLDDLDLRGRVDISSLANYIARDQEEEERAREAQLRRESTSQHRGHRKGGSSCSSSCSSGGSGGSGSNSGGGATIALTKLVIGLGLYPNIALRCPHNIGRPLAEHQFLTRQRGGLFMQPNCALTAANLDAASAGSSGGMGSSASGGGGVLARDGRQQAQNDVLVFSHLMETHKPFLSSVLACPAPSFLLLACQTIDTDATGTRLLFDHWLMVEMRDGAVAAECVAKAIVLQAALEAACEDQLVPLRRQEAPLETSSSASQPHQKGGVAEDSATLPACLQPLRDAWLVHCPLLLAHAKGPSSSASASVTTIAAANAAASVTDTTTSSTMPPRYLPPAAASLLASSKNNNYANDDTPSLANELASFLEADWGCLKLRALPKGGAEAARLLFDGTLDGEDEDGSDWFPSAAGVNVAESDSTGNSGARTSADSSTQSNHAAIRALEACVENPLGLLDHLWRFKKGQQLSPHLRWGSLADQDAMVPTTVSEHMFSKWTCPRCGTSALLNASGVRDHLQRSCFVAGSAGDGAGSTETAATAPARAATTQVNEAMDASFASDRQLAEARSQASQADTNRGPKKSRRRLGTSVKGVRS